MASRDEVIDVSSFVNMRKVGTFQFLVVGLCALTVFLDGFDTQSIAFVAPSIAQDWHVNRVNLGPIFSASLFGLLCGALFFGPVADKLGRRSVIMICTIIFGGFTIMTANAGSVNELMIFRFLGGLGMGGAMPNCIALTAEYCPERRRATLVMIMFTGFSLGAAAGGGAAAALIPAYGWRSVWYVGGIIPLLILPIQYLWLPESVRFLVVSNAAKERIARIIRRLDRRYTVPADARFEISEVRAPGVPVAYLFRGGRSAGTVFMWIMFFMNLLDLFLVQNWLPIFSHDAGIPVQTAVIIGTLFQVGGVVACLFVGFPIDRFGAYKILPLVYGLGAVFVAVLGMTGASVPALMLLTFGAGFCIIGGQNSANALASIFYPTAMRATGSGWCLGIGRIGAIIGPLIGGFLLSLKWPFASIFLFGGIPLLCAAVAVYMMGRTYGREANMTRAGSAAKTAA